VLPIAFAVMATVPDGTWLRAADDVVLSPLTCVDGVVTKFPHSVEGGRLLRRRWLCDVDGQVNGECIFGRRCRPSRLLAQGFESPSIRCQCSCRSVSSDNRDP